MSTYKEFRMQTKRRRAKRIAIRVGMLVLILALLFTACYVGIRVWMTKNDLNKEVPITPIAPTETLPVPPAPPATDITPVVSTVWNTVLPFERTINIDAQPVQDYRLLALPENGKVSKEFFRNALFIGDSLTQGFGMYGDSALEGIAMINGYIGASPKSFVDNVSLRGSAPILDEVFSRPIENVHAVYVLLGTNVLPSYQKDEQIMKYYYDLLPILKAHFLPSTVFYIQGMPPISAAKDGTRAGMSNERIRGLNNQIASMAALNGMSYVDLEEALADEAGYLPADIASKKDGYHMHDGTGYARWVDYLQRHTVFDVRHIEQYETAPGAC